MQKNLQRGKFVQGHPTDRFGKLSVRKPLIPDDFLKRIFTLNFRDMGNLRTSVFELIKMSFWERK